MKQLKIDELINENEPKRGISSDNLNNPALLRDIPFEKIYESARKEASRKKPVFFIHKYFARRITANFRMALLGLLLPYEEDIWDYFYESVQLDDSDTITLIDPFMGGGTTIFESERINARTIGNDLQPLSKFVTEALVSEIDEKKVKKAVKELDKTVGKKIKSYYTTTCPDCEGEADVMYNFHVKTVKTGSQCKEHSLFSNFLLSVKKGITTLVCPECLEVFEHNFSDGSSICPCCSNEIIDPRNGYVSRGRFSCNTCGEEKQLRDYKEETGYPNRSRIIAQEYYCPTCKKRGYKKVLEEDIQLYEKAKKDLEKLEEILPIPFQEIPEGYNTRQMKNHGYMYFRDLFNPRQKLCLGLLLKSIDEYPDEDVKFWLLLAFSGALEMNNTFCRYQHNAYKICNIFFNHAYVPISMPVENNVWGTKLGTGTFIKTIDKIIRGKKFNKDIYDIKAVIDKGSNKAKFKSQKMYSSDKVESQPTSDFGKLDISRPLITNNDSRNLNHIPDESIDIILTDPPYGSNIMYSELIDFFHCWNHTSKFGRKIGFKEPLSPKVEEIIVNSAMDKTYDDYKNGLTQVFKEMHRVAKDNAYLVFSFHDKSLDSWFSVANAIINAGFKLVRAYPLHSETRTGGHTSNKNSIAFDIYLICEKVANNQKTAETLDENTIYNLENNALKTTEDFVKRLASVDAEMTLPDIENIFLSQFFASISSLGLQGFINSEIIKTSLSKILNRLETLFDEYHIKEIRKGWWSELYNVDFKNF